LVWWAWRRTFSPCLSPHGLFLRMAAATVIGGVTFLRSPIFPFATGRIWSLLAFLAHSLWMWPSPNHNHRWSFCSWPRRGRKFSGCNTAFVWSELYMPPSWMLHDGGTSVWKPLMDFLYGRESPGRDGGLWVGSVLEVGFGGYALPALLLFFVIIYWAPFWVHCTFPARPRSRSFSSYAFCFPFLQMFFCLSFAERSNFSFFCGIDQEIFLTNFCFRKLEVRGELVYRINFMKYTL